MNQSEFSFDEPSITSEPVDETLSYRQALLEQIIRDKQTLKMDPAFWAPSKEFYEGRIRSYIEAIVQLDEEDS